MIHTPGRIGVDAVLEPLELVHGHMMDHVLRLHLGHLLISNRLGSRICQRKQQLEPLSAEVIKKRPRALLDLNLKHKQ